MGDNLPWNDLDGRFAPSDAYLAVIGDPSLTQKFCQSAITVDSSYPDFKQIGTDGLINDAPAGPTDRTIGYWTLQWHETRVHLFELPALSEDYTDPENAFRLGMICAILQNSLSLTTPRQISLIIYIQETIPGPPEWLTAAADGDQFVMEEWHGGESRGLLNELINQSVVDDGQVITTEIPLQQQLRNNPTMVNTGVGALLYRHLNDVANPSQAQKDAATLLKSNFGTGAATIDKQAEAAGQVKGMVGAIGDPNAKKQNPVTETAMEVTEVVSHVLLEGLACSVM